MTPKELQELSTVANFPQSAAEIIRIAGIDAAARLISAWPGQEFPVPIAGANYNKYGARRFEQLNQVVGEEAARRITAFWGGQIMDIPNCQIAITSLKHNAIRGTYDELTCREGNSHKSAIFQHGILYNLSGRTVEKILRTATYKPQKGGVN